MGIDLTDWIEVFRAGDYPQGSFTPADVEEMAAKYDPNIHEAPITLDHNDKGPSYGWVEKLKTDGGVLLAKFKQVSDSLKELVSSGAYKKRSAEIYPKLDSTGSKYLRAVSFVTVPQVKGLQPAFGDAMKFSDTKGEFQSVSFEVETKQKTYKPKSDEGGVMDEKQVQTLIDKAVTPFSEKILKLEADKKADEDKIAQLEEQNKNTLTKLSDSEKAQQEIAVNTFCESMKKELRLTPAMEASAKPLLSVLAGVSGTVKFSETDKDGKTTEVEKTPFVLFRDFIKSLPKIDSGEFASGDYGKRSSGKYANFTDKRNSPVDEMSVEIAERADEIVAKDDRRDVNEAQKYAEAMIRAEKELGGK